MKKSFLLSATAVVFAGSITFAEPSFAQTETPVAQAEQTPVAMQIAELDSLGFKRIEVKTGLTQTKIEAINVATNEKREIVMDTAMGTILSEEVGTISPWDNTEEGVVYRTRNRNFVEDDDNGADTSGSASDDDNGGDTSGRSSDENDDRSDDDRGSDSNDSGGSSDSND